MKAPMFKYKTQLYEINHLLETAHIQKAMEDGTYKRNPEIWHQRKRTCTVYHELQPQTRR